MFCYFPLRRYCNEYVCLFVCFFVGLSAPIARKPYGRTSPNFCACFLWSWLDMHLNIRFYGWRHVSRNQNQARFTLCLKEVRQVAVPYKQDVRQLQCLVEFVRMRRCSEVCCLRLPCYSLCQFWSYFSILIMTFVDIVNGTEHCFGVFFITCFFFYFFGQF